MVGTTPDRHPGTLEEERLRLTSDEGKTAEVPGDIVFTGTDFSMKDAIGVFNPRSGGGGITEAEHELLDTLTHWLDETNWQEMVRDGNGKVTNAIHWETSGKLKKVREVIITRATGKVSQIDIIQYNSAGAEKQRLVLVIARAGGKVSSIQWTKTVT